jgi:hypothetical protein
VASQPAVALDEQRLQALLGQAIGEVGGTVNAALIVIGDRLGLFGVLAEGDPVQPRGRGPAMTRSEWPRRLVAALVASVFAGSLAAPAASASPALEPVIRESSAFEPPVQVSSADDGVDWISALIGAGAAGGVLLVSAAGLTAASRRRVIRHNLLEERSR